MSPSIEFRVRHCRSGAYVLCTGAVKKPVDVGVEMDYLIPLYNIVETLSEKQRFEAIEFLRKNKNVFFFSKSDYGLEYETQLHSQEDFNGEVSA